MTDFATLIDTARLRAAEDTHNSLALAVRNSEVALTKAQADAVAANATAQAAADRGADAKTLDAAEVAVDAASRAVRTAERVLQAAQKRLTDGGQTRDSEVKQSHGKAMNSAMVRLLAIRSEALAALAKLEALKMEHGEVNAQFVAMATAAKSGLPNYVDHCRALLGSDGRLMDAREFDNRTSQNAHHEWDGAAQKLRWMEG